MGNLRGFTKGSDTHLSAKDFLTRDNRMRLQTLIIAVMICGTVLSAMGIALVAISSNDNSESSIDLLGLFEVNTGNIGVAAIAIGAAVIIFGIKSFMKRWE